MNIIEYEQYDTEDIEFIQDGEEFFNGNSAHIKSPSGKFYWSYYNSDNSLRDMFVSICKEKGIENTDIYFGFNFKRANQPPIHNPEEMRKYCMDFIEEYEIKKDIYDIINNDSSDNDVNDG